MRRVFLGLLCMLNALSFCCMAQERSFGKVDLRDDNACMLKAPEGYLDEFWASCSSLSADSTVSVVHLGDSHVQGGFFSMPIRDFFDDYFGLAGLGWVAPYSFFRTNQPYPSKCINRGGAWSGCFITRRKYSGSPSPTGIAMTATGKGIHEVEIRADGFFPIKKAVVFRDASASPVYIKGEIPKGHSAEVKGTVVVDTLSIKLNTGTLSLMVPAGTTWYGVSLESYSSGVLLHTIGYNGAFYSSFCVSEFVDHLSMLRPKLILVSLGTNDLLVQKFSSSTFAQNVRMLVRSLQRSMPNVAIVLTSPLASYRQKRIRKRQYVWEYNPNAGVVAKVLEEEANALGCGYIDLFDTFGGAKGFDALLRSNVFAGDSIHLTKEGYYLVGDAISFALLKDYRRYLGSEKEPDKRWQQGSLKWDVPSVKQK